MFIRHPRIGIDGREFTGQVTGIARIFKIAVEKICQLRSNWEFTVFGNQRTLLPFQTDHLAFLRHPERLTFWWDQVTLAYHLGKEKIDLFLSPYYKIPLFSPCPVIHILHDLIPLTSEAYQSTRFFLKRTIFYAAGYLYAQRSRLILTDSFYSKMCIQRMFKVPEEKVRVIYPGLSEEFQRPKDEEILRQLQEKYSFRPPFLLTVGNFKPHKRVDCLLNAYSLLPKAVRERFPLVLAGPLNPWGFRFKEVVNKTGLSGQVIFTDYLSNEALKTLYQSAHLFIFPSSDEGFGLPPLESMACGVPVIASKAASIPEVVQDAASLVPPGDSIALSAEMKRFLEDEKLRNSFSRKGLERARFFSTEKQAREMIGIMEELLSEK